MTITIEDLNKSLGGHFNMQSVYGYMNRLNELDYDICRPFIKIFRTKSLTPDMMLQRCIAVSYDDPPKSVVKRLKVLKNKKILKCISFNSYYVYTFKIIADNFWPEDIDRMYLRPQRIINYLCMLPLDSGFISTPLTRDISDVSDISLLFKHDRNYRKISDRSRLYNQTKADMEHEFNAKKYTFNYNGQYIDCRGVRNLYYKLEVGDKLGEGSFGNVYLAKINGPDTIASLVVKFFDGIRETKIIDFWNRRVNLSYRLVDNIISNNENINLCATLKVFRSSMDNEASERKKYKGLPLCVLERIDCDLYAIFGPQKKKVPPIRPFDIRDVLIQMISGMRALHTNGYAHTDIKLENTFAMKLPRPTHIYYRIRKNVYRLTTKVLVLIGDFDNIREPQDTKNELEEHPFNYMRYYGALSNNVKKLYNNLGIHALLQRVKDLRYNDWMTLIFFVAINDLSLDVKFPSDTLDDIIDDFVDTILEERDTFEKIDESKIPESEIYTILR